MEDLIRRYGCLNLLELKLELQEIMVMDCDGMWIGEGMI
jgi:hypothetical protein